MTITSLNGAERSSNVGNIIIASHLLTSLYGLSINKQAQSEKSFTSRGNDVTLRYTDYDVTFGGICFGPEGTEDLGACTQMAVFHKKLQSNDCSNVTGIQGLFKLVDCQEYPYEKDDRAECEKILEDCSYYIPRLINQQSSSAKGLNLEILMSKLGKYSIATTDDLKDILVTGGFEILEKKGVGPVILHANQW